MQHSAQPVLADGNRFAELDRLGDEIAVLSAHLEAGTARLLDLIREFDARGGLGQRLSLLRPLAVLADWARPGGGPGEGPRGARPRDTAAPGPGPGPRGDLLREGASHHPGRGGGRAHPDDPPGLAARAPASGSRLPLPGLRRAVHPGPSPPPLGPGRPDHAFQPGVALPTASPGRARGEVSGGARGGWGAPIPAAGRPAPARGAGTGRAARGSGRGAAGTARGCGPAPSRADDAPLLARGPAGPRLRDRRPAPAGPASPSVARALHLHGRLTFALSRTDIGSSCKMATRRPSIR